MKHETVRASAFAMPLTNPAFPAGPYRFVNREYFIIQYRTDLEALRRIVPEPLAITEPVVNYEFIRMPDSTGFGDYTESGQVIPVSYQGQAGSFVHQMFLNDHPPIAGLGPGQDFDEGVAIVAMGFNLLGRASWRTSTNSLNARYYILVSNLCQVSR